MFGLTPAGKEVAAFYTVETQEGSILVLEMEINAKQTNSSFVFKFSPKKGKRTSVAQRRLPGPWTERKTHSDPLLTFLLGTRRIFHRSVSLCCLEPPCPACILLCTLARFDTHWNILKNHFPIMYRLAWTLEELVQSESCQRDTQGSSGIVPGFLARLFLANWAWCRNQIQLGTYCTEKSKLTLNVVVGGPPYGKWHC